jgi:outer membrane receptor protein involved in Fe transport
MVHALIALSVLSSISGKIQGTVTDEQTGDPIAYVDVILTGTERGAATDERGNFYLLDVSAGTYTVEVSCLGYGTKIIKDVRVEIDQTARLYISLKQTPIEIAPVTVTSELPPVQKDMIGTTYIVRREELTTLPIDYTTELVAFQPAVTRADTALHVRGGRATEVLYLIDNVSILDPQTGDPAIYISKGVVDEIIFLPGGFDVEYGRAMSGVINLITSFPSDKLRARVYGKTERIMPYYYDFGYETFQGSAHLPVSKWLRGFVAADLMHTDDWNPRLYIRPHKQRDDYSLYGKFFITPSPALKLTASTALSRMQFDRYNTKWMFNLDNYRSDMRKGDLEIVTMRFLPDQRKLVSLTLSRLNTTRTYGVREPGDLDPFTDFTFKDYESLVWPRGSINNPFGADIPYLPIEGDYQEYQEKSSEVMRAHLSSILQLHENHEFKIGGEYTYQEFDNFTYFISDTANPVADEYHYAPREYAAYIQDNIDFEGLYAKLGCRVDYFDKDPSEVILPASNDSASVEPVVAVSPRIGFSFMVTENFLFRANIGRYVQPPLYDYMYSYYSLVPFPSHITLEAGMGNPLLEPEITMSYELGLQGQIRENMSLTVNAFYKDVSNLIGSVFEEFYTDQYMAIYGNIEYANVRGIETIFEFVDDIFTGKISYTLSWARGTSSYASEVWFQYYYYEDYEPEMIFTPASQDYYLDFDQRHRIFVQGTVNLPAEFRLFVLGYLGSGFPYTPPGEIGKTEERNTLRLTFQRQIDCVLSKTLNIAGLKLDAQFEVINLLDARYEITAHYPIKMLETIKPWDFPYFFSIGDPLYHPAADENHDGLVTPDEDYRAFRACIAATDDWINANSAPRRARIGVSLQL